MAVEEEAAYTAPFFAGGDGARCGVGVVDGDDGDYDGVSGCGGDFRLPSGQVRIRGRVGDEGDVAFRHLQVCRLFAIVPTAAGLADVEVADLLDVDVVLMAGIAGELGVAELEGQLSIEGAGGGHDADIHFVPPLLLPDAMRM